MTIPDSVRALMARKPLAHLTRLNARIYMGRPASSLRRPCAIGQGS